MGMTHRCHAPDGLITPDGEGAHGAAVTDCWADARGNLWAGNGEYSNRVNYCPFCGEPGTVLIAMPGTVVRNV